MKLVYENVAHVLHFSEGVAVELVVENKKLFYQMVNDLTVQTDGGQGGFVLSIEDKPVEISKNADVTLQFAPFQLNRKGLLTKLYSFLEKTAVQPENYIRTGELLGAFELFVAHLADELPFDIDCRKMAVGTIIRAVAPEIEDNYQNALERIFAYMEFVRELDRDRLFVMINMRAYFSDEEMERFIESICLHDFKVLLLESHTYGKLKNMNRYTVDEDLCEF